MFNTQQQGSGIQELLARLKQNRQPQQAQINPIGLLQGLASLKKQPSQPPTMPEPTYNYSGNINAARQDFTQNLNREQQLSDRGEERGFQTQERQREREGFQKGLSEIASMKAQKGKDLTYDQILGTIGKYVPSNIAASVAANIVNAQESAKPETKDVSEYDPITGQTRLRRVGASDLEKGIVTGQAKAEKPKTAYEIGAVKEFKLGKNIITKEVTGHDDKGKPVWENIGTSPIDKGEAEPTTFNALSFEQKNKLNTAYNAADPLALQAQGINDMEDFAISNKILSKPEGYTLVPDLSVEINKDGKLKPEEATKAANQAIKAFGKIDTLKKWREKALEIENAKTKASEQKTAKIEEQKTARVEAKKPKESPAGFPVTMTNDGVLWDKTANRRIMTPQKMTVEFGEFKKKNPKYLEYINLLDKYGYIDPKEANAKKQEYNDLKLQSILKKRK